MNRRSNYNHNRSYNGGDRRPYNDRNQGYNNRRYGQGGGYNRSYNRGYNQGGYNNRRYGNRGYSTRDEGEDSRRGDDRNHDRNGDRNDRPKGGRDRDQSPQRYGNRRNHTAQGGYR